MEEERPPSRRDEDAELAERLRQGDVSALEQLVERHSGAVGRLISALVDDPELAVDLVQETFLRAWHGAAGYRGGSVTAWLGRIAVNAARDQHRSYWRRRVELGEPPGTLVGPVDEQPQALAIRHELTERVRAALAQLPRRQAEALRLRFIAGESYVSMVELTGLPESTLRSRVKAGLTRLKVLLADLFDGD